MDKPFQRKGSESNAHVGRDFEAKIQTYFEKQGLSLSYGVTVPIGVTGKKPHSFDLGSKDGKILVECKAHRWTEGGNVPSAKLTVWNEAMFFFHTAPSGYRKLLVVLHDFSSRRNETLGEYYVRTYSHLIPEDVEVWEYDENGKHGKRIK
ncbi:conserved hypothetical protein [uncultured Desulfobacterium sp.]|uniref:Uncharacterized protein n=1 Tax=uncultured Desulfobacterium sp. TaxID=201089 RepID=A0A445MRY2_9BACT|nr:conserved hypothetical protein [uncultured Desulfobacterium sp.]